MSCPSIQQKYDCLLFVDEKGNHRYIVATEIIAFGGAEAFGGVFGEAFGGVFGGCPKPQSWITVRDLHTPLLVDELPSTIAAVRAKALEHHHRMRKQIILEKCMC